MTTSPQAPVGAAPTIHKASGVLDASGVVEWWDVLTEHEAVDRRKQGLDIVVRGPDGKQNRRKAREIEMQVGTPVVFDLPHARAGPRALPHYHQDSRSPEGHSFYEVGGRKARKKP